MPPRDFPFAGRRLCWPRTNLCMQAVILPPEAGIHPVRLCPAPIRFASDIIGARAGRVLIFDVRHSHTVRLFKLAHDTDVAAEVLEEDAIAIPGSALCALMNTVHPEHVSIVDTTRSSPTTALHEVRRAWRSLDRPALARVPGSRFLLDSVDRTHLYVETTSPVFVLRLIDRLIRLRTACLLAHDSPLEYVPPVPADLLEAMLAPRQSIELLDAEATVERGVVRIPVWGSGRAPEAWLGYAAPRATWHVHGRL